MTSIINLIIFNKMEGEMNTDADMETYDRIIKDNQEQSGSVTKKDFEMISVIGKGSYGKVTLVKKKDSQKLYALKILKKSEIVRRNQVEHTMTERRILVSYNLNFSLINSIGKYQTPVYREDGLCLPK